LRKGGWGDGWGRNTDGRVGNGTTNVDGELDTPVFVSGLTVATEVSQADGGGAFTCARTTTGAAQCWGHNHRGQVGNGLTPSETLYATPSPVVGLSSGVVSVSSGSLNACAIVTGGGLKCWGSNAYGQLGTGGGDSSTPV